MTCHVQSMSPCSPSSTSTIPAYDSDSAGTDMSNQNTGAMMQKHVSSGAIDTTCTLDPIQDSGFQGIKEFPGSMVKSIDKATKPKENYSKTQISKQPRMCAYEHCPSPMHSNKWRVVTPQTSAGGRDWLPLLGMTLCDSCYSTYRKHAT